MAPAIAPLLDSQIDALPIRPIQAHVGSPRAVRGHLDLDQYDMDMSLEAEAFVDVGRAWQENTAT